MAQWSTTIRNLWISSTETAIGTSPVLRIRSGSAPANCEAADTGTVLSEIPLPADWLTAPSNGSASNTSVWQDISADATGNMGHFRLYSSGGTCHLQGSIGLSGSGSDIIVGSIVVVEGGTFTINSFLAASTGA